MSDNFLEAFVEVEHLGFRKQVEIIILFLKKIKNPSCVVEIEAVGQHSKPVQAACSSGRTTARSLKLGFQ